MVEWLTAPPAWVVAAAILAAAGLSASLVRRLFMRTLRELAGRSRSEFDDIFVSALGRPLSLSVLLIGIWAAQSIVMSPGTPRNILASLLQSVAVIVWATAGLRLSGQVLDLVSQVGTGDSVIHSRVQPVLDLGVKALMVALGAYGLLLAWGVDLTAWLASAGIVGVVVGLAAQDSLANLFAGMSVALDSPYQQGDFIELGDGRCGRVTDIGFRSTRILTEDAVEITVPNSTMASASIVNWTGGPSVRRRIAVTVGVGYDSDPDEVADILVRIARETSGVITDVPTAVPTVHLRGFGDSSLDFVLLFWITRPETRYPIQDAVNRAIVREFAKAGIEIPFPKRDVTLIDPSGSSS